MKKLIIPILLTMCMLLGSAAACGNNGGNNEDINNPPIDNPDDGGNKNLGGGDNDNPPPVVTDDGKENKKDGYIFYEDFTKREKVPGYFDKTVRGFARTEIEEGALRMTVINGGTNDLAFFNYEFSQPLTGKFVVETKVKADASPFINLLFFFGETQDFFSTSQVVTNLCMEGRNFKNNSGSGWSSTSITYETGEWYNVKMAVDTDGEFYNLTVGDKTKRNLPFRKSATPIKYLRFGSQTAWADVSYEYIGIRTATEADFPQVEEGVNYINNFDGTQKPADIEYTSSAGGSADFSTEGQVTLKTPTSGTVSVSKTFDEQLEGTFAAEVKFKNLSSAQNTFANVLFLRNSALSGTSGNIVTVAVESGILRYHMNGKWNIVEYNSNSIGFIDGEWYVLKAVCDSVKKTVKLYLSGGKILSGGNETAFGEDIYLGEFDFRNKTAGNPDMLELAIGVGKANTAFAAEYIKVYNVL